jgi:hypothetical protein
VENFCFNERTVENFLQASPDPEMGHSGGVDPPVWKLHTHYGDLSVIMSPNKKKWEICMGQMRCGSNSWEI